MLQLKQHTIISIFAIVIPEIISRNDSYKYCCSYSYTNAKNIIHLHIRNFKEIREVYVLLLRQKETNSKILSNTPI